MSNFQISPTPDPRFPEITPAVTVGDYMLPRRFRAGTEVEGLAVELDIELDDAASPICRAVSIRSGTGSVDGAALRAVPVRKLLGEATSHAAQRIVPAEEKAYIQEHGTGEWFRYHPEEGPGSELDTLRPMTPSERRSFYEEIAGAGGPGRGSRVTDEHLARVAEVYRKASEFGDPPTQAVADAMHCARSTAGRWVVEARKRKLLGPATKGRAGENKGDD